MNIGVIGVIEAGTKSDIFGDDDVWVWRDVPEVDERIAESE